MKAQKENPRESGQASIFIGLMLMTFILFFAFVVNTGMLVNAKINLQNAADLAAYSGAAHQARLLNSISFLNFEMRRAYKKFLFRYYVIGNMAQKGFPRAGGAGPMLWSPDGTQPYDYQVPSVCIIFNGADNYCQLSKLPEIKAPPKNPLDAINSVLVSQLEAIEKIRNDNCAAIATTNTYILELWLYNTDPGFKQLSANPVLAKSMNTIKGLASGLGLIPRELMLSQRIKTLAQYINAAPQRGVTFDAMSGLQGSPDPISVERTVDAFLSAYNTLGENTFPADSITMDELLPDGGQGAKLIELHDVKASFDTYAVDFQPNGASTGDCTPSLQAISIPESGLTLGVYKDPSVLTYYAVRLKAKARVLFSPFGDMEMTAYSAARPFGSRLGPALKTDEMLTREGYARGKSALSIDIRKKIPNLPVKTEDVAVVGKGWDTQDTMAALYHAMQAAPNTELTMENFERGIHVAMGPNPWEGNKYDIPNNLAGDKFGMFFDTKHNAVLWAPVFPKDSSSGMADEIKAAVEEFMAPPSGGGMAAQKNMAQLQALMDEMKKGIGTYLGALSQGVGENQEGMNTVVLTDPFYTRPEDPANGGPAKPLGDIGGFLVSDPKQYRTSWNGAPDDSVKAVGRVGYSVKFVSFDSLITPHDSSNGDGELPSNRPDGGAEGDADFGYLKH